MLATKKHNSRHQKEFLKMGEEGLGEVDEQRYMTLNSLKYKGRVRLKEKSYIELGDGEVKNTIDQKKT